MRMMGPPSQELNNFVVNRFLTIRAFVAGRAAEAPLSLGRFTTGLGDKVVEAVDLVVLGVVDGVVLEQVFSRHRVLPQFLVFAAHAVHQHRGRQDRVHLLRRGRLLLLILQDFKSPFNH